ncbi:hypothetical protein TVAG_457560 [Trichomonas vaginalis G3]|uniref:HYDIN/VesB/CFA65-like Ig-like domain-containing protein n=1 Tax=Trichomonas vaginalis (strain ATCC PRA-98 / G3) TaxID=412133 RepID=A2DC79_TRIV3|nr:deleted in lung and esophageal cancer 1 (DLEC1) family [Trichomonas vaginalis G3]EAY22120.1 hypothetical protein TVAG_457560 [Trichomonas vaginalis G3]KAI5525213.1 deleted in lung and esophageal cancer 1 (DLEC1) family [Trichomonas vaginalis G3]|eukprot:XP_001583106.1 hypothetical protein [Trichomonas vaginalis G3]
MLEYDIDDPLSRPEYIKSLLFRSENFSIEPIRGELFPGRSQLMVFMFHPKEIGKISQYAYLTNARDNTRYPLLLTGQCLPPSAKFGVQVINCGHISLDSILEYQVFLHNTGDSDGLFELIENTNEFNIKFSPTSGRIPIGASIPINILLTADKVGKFNEEFKYKIDGSVYEEYPSITLYGRIVGPSFEIKTKSIDFEEVSCGFLHSKTFDIQNTSDIPLDYTIKFDSDYEINSREIQITPPGGTVAPRGTQTIKVDFIPSGLHAYRGNINVLSKNMDKMYTIPLSGVSRVPNIRLEKDRIDLGDVFINFPYSINIVLKNNSKLSGKFDVLENNDMTFGFNVKNSRPSGIIQSYSTIEIPLQMTATQLGEMSFTKLIRIYGSDNPPLSFTVTFKCIGPTYKISQDFIDFGRIPILKKITRVFTIENTALIPMEYKLSIEKNTDVFSLDTNSGKIPPKEKQNIVISAFLDDGIKFDTEIQVCLSMTIPFVVKVAAVGVGISLIPNINLENVEIENAFAGQKVSYPFIVSNKGRIPKELKWTIPKFEKQEELSYSLEPSEVVIEPYSDQTFTIYLDCENPNLIEFSAFCQLILRKKKVDLFRPKFKIEFEKVLVEIKNKIMNYKFDYDYKNEVKNNNLKPSKSLLPQIPQKNSIKNTSHLPLKMLLKPPHPFILSNDSFVLQPEETADFDVIFDTSFKTNFVSENIDRNLQIYFEDNPQKYFIKLKARMNFPNLAIEEKEIDFGHISIGAEKNLQIKVHNKSEIAAEYEWQIAGNESLAFDVYPLRSSVNKNEEETVNFVFFGAGNDSQTFSATAICHVKGGPDYTLSLKGSTAKISYEIDTTTIDFGDVNFTDYLQSSVMVYNEGDIDISFDTVIPSKTKFNFIKVEPKKFSVKPNDKLKLKVSIWPGIPQQFKEHFTLITPNLTEIQINLIANCLYQHNNIIFNDMILNENRDEELSLLVEQSEEILSKPKNNSEEYRQKRQKCHIGRGKIESKPLFTFDIDFGDVVLHDLIQKSLFIENDSIFKSNFVIFEDEESIFTISPKNVSGIPPNAKTEIKIEFDPAHLKEIINGNVTFQYKIMTSDFLYYIMNVKINLISPKLIFSQNIINFQQTIVGQERIMTLQLRNMNKVPINFVIGDGISQTVLKQKDVFMISSNCGEIKEQSYTNIDITFSPKQGKEYSYQFPVFIKFSNEENFIFCNGTGNLLKLSFFPPIADFEQIMPFSDITTMQVLLTNPSNHPIEVFSRQFDANIITDQITRMKTGTPLTKSRNRMQNSQTNILFDNTQTQKVCLIVHGPSNSGKTLICQKLSEKYGNIPIIRLKDIKNQNFDNYFDVFQESIKDFDFFIIDGLDCFDEREETLQFLTQMTKVSKNDEVFKNLFHELKNKANLPIFEENMKKLLDILKGFYVYLIVLDPSTDLLKHRFDSLLHEQSVEQMRIELNEKMNLINMTEEEYEKLTDEEKNDIDRRRKELRNQKIVAEPQTKSKVSSARRSKKKTSQKSAQNVPVKSPKSSQIFVDSPFYYDIYLFRYSFHIISDMIQSPENGCVVFDPTIINCEKIEDHVNNILVIKNESKIEDEVDKIFKYFPGLTELKTFLFQKSIPPPRLIVPVTDDIPNSDDQPLFFNIATDSNDENVFGNCTDRWKIEAGESCPIMIQFYGQNVGFYEDKLTFSISGYKSEVFTLSLKANVLYPEIERDFANIFGDVTDKLTTKMKLQYVKSLNSFFFGYNILQKEKMLKSDGSKVKKYLNITNKSVFVTTVNAVLMKPAPKGVWSIDTNTFDIDPGESCSICVTFSPIQIGTFENVIGIYIRDNPEPLFLPIFATCLVPALKFSCNSLDFDKIITNQVSQREIMIQNDENVAAYWRIKGGNTLGKIFTIAPLEGFLNPNTKSKISLQFSSPKQILFKKSISIEIMDKTKLRTFDTKNINIIAEAYDVNFAIEYQENSSSLDFGIMKVGQSKTVSLVMKTLGKYPILYKFMLDNSKEFLQNMKLSSMNGGVQPNKNQEIQFTFTATKMKKFNQTKGISVLINDTLTGSEIALVQIPFSAQSVYSSFEISPKNEIDFQTIPIMKSNTKTFTIKNIGFFEFSFVLNNINQQQREIEQKANKKVVKEPKGNSGSKRHLNKMPTSLIVSETTVITPCFGIIKPNETQEFTVEVKPNKIQKVTETFLIQISDINPKFVDGITFNLTSNSISSSLVCDDYEQIFKTINICSSKDPIQNTNSWFYDQKILHFMPTLVNSKNETEFLVINNSLVSCDVDVSIKNENKKESDIFIVSEKQITLEGNESKLVKIAFEPKTIGSFQANLTATAKNSLYPPISFKLEAISEIPSIDVHIKTDEGISQDDIQPFDCFLISFKSEKVIVLNNDGNLAATVLVSLSPSPDFILSTEYNKITVKPHSEFFLPIVFHPQKPRKSTVVVTLNLMENPEFEKKITFYGEGVFEPVYVQGNTLTKQGGPTLIFNDTTVGKPAKVDFLIKNVSNDCYRFSFNHDNDFTFSPRVGHIHPNTSKKVTCTFIADRVVSFKNKTISCQRTKINLQDNSSDWDDSKTVMKYVKRSQLDPNNQAPTPPAISSSRSTASVRKSIIMKSDEEKSLDDDYVVVEDIEPEPPYTVVRERTSDMQVVISAAADSISYLLHEDLVDFPTTMIYETKVQQFAFENTCNIGFNYFWRFKSLDTLMQNPDKRRILPFVINPPSGYLKPKEKIVFDVTFSPIIDDEFTASFICDIDNLKTEPPKLFVCGVSKRPIVHINFEQSDYLTSNRRTSDQIINVPENIRVLEIVSNAKGNKSVKTFEMINTTDTPYEVYWECVKDTSNNSIKCTTPQSFISSGKRFFCTFEFTPKSHQTVESLWSFSIPAYDLKAEILIVGRVFNSAKN